MGKDQGRQPARMPATKFANLRKQMQKRRVESRLIDRKRPQK
jgi:hypothetical protein